MHEEPTAEVCISTRNPRFRCCNLSDTAKTERQEQKYVPDLRKRALFLVIAVLYMKNYDHGPNWVIDRVLCGDRRTGNVGERCMMAYGMLVGVWLVASKASGKLMKHLFSQQHTPSEQ